MSVSLIRQSTPDLRSLVAAFAARAGQYDRDATFPHENFRDLHAAGLLGLTAPRRFGGNGAGLEEAAEIIGVVAEGCASTALVFAMHLIKQAGVSRASHWPERLRSEVATDAVRRGALINALRVEPELGSPTRGGLPATTIRRAPNGGWLLSGHKTYATGAPGLGWMSVWARTDEDHVRVGYVLVPARAAGVRVVESWDHLGMRATGSHDVVFEGVRLPDEYVAELRRPEDWPGVDPLQQVWNAVGLGALYTGIAHAARDWIVQFLHERVPTGLGKPLATLPRMQEKVGEVEALLLTNARLITSAAADADRGVLPDPVEAGLLKTVLVENAVRAVETAALLAGNHAHSRANPIERYLRDVLCGRVHVPNVDAAFVAAGWVALSGASRVLTR